MAAAPSSSSKSSLREDLTCSICCDLFREPVMLPCMHHFCKACISRYWRPSHGPVSCPHCRKEFLHKQFQTNFLVAAMVEKVRATTSNSYIKSLEKKLRAMMESHRQRKEKITIGVRKDKDLINAINRVGTDIKSHIRGEFRALHQILEEEEASMLDQVTREQDEQLESVRRHLEASETAMRDLEENMQVLQQFSSAIDNIEPGEQLPQLRPFSHVDEAHHFDMDTFSNRYLAPLQYVTWRRMFKSLKPGLSPLTFDVDTAHPSIHVSRDKTAAVECDFMTQRGAHSKRFLQCVNLLAEQSFHCGRHYWEVEVGACAKWDLGVASEAVDRHARIKLSPENGYWTLRLRNGNEYWAGTQPWTRLQVGSSPQRLGVYLDCDDRKVSFYDADDMSLIYAFNNGPRGKVFPFFSPCISDGRHGLQPLKLLHHPTVSLHG